MMQQWEEYICCRCDTNFQINEFGMWCGMEDDFPDMLDDEDFDCSGSFIHNVQCPVCHGTEFIIAFMSHAMPKRSCVYRDGRMRKLREFNDIGKMLEDYTPVETIFNGDHIVDDCITM